MWGWARCEAAIASTRNRSTSCAEEPDAAEQPLQGDHAAAAQLPGTEDDPHPPLAKLLEELEAAEPDRGSA